VEGTLVGDDDVLAGAVLVHAVGTRQLDGVLGGLGAGAQEEDLVIRARRGGGQEAAELGAALVGEHVGGQERLVDRLAQCLADLRAAMAGVGHQHAARPVQPGVAPAVEDLEALGAVPDHRRLALHADRFVAQEFLENRQRFGYRNGRGDPAVLGVDERNVARNQIVLVISHVSQTPCWRVATMTEAAMRPTPGRPQI